jgi:ubiquinone/menaquinone biosynthesis C-methylase UbiE
MKGFDQDTIKGFYQLWARPYRWLVPFYLLGNEGRLRRKAVNALHLEPGQVVLDLGCGTGRNFPYIMEHIGSQGLLIGLDYTPAMLQEAEQLIQRRHWSNVELIQADAAELSLEQPVDAAVSTLAMSVIPDYREALRRMIGSVRAGGRVTIAGARRSERAYARPFNFVADGLGWGAAANLGRRPWETLAELVEAFACETFFLGFFYVAAGSVPHTTE